MNGAFLLVLVIVIFGIAYRWYGGRLARLFDIDSGRPTPAVTLNDGVDYVLTATPVLFGHHFASIAGAGPIVGPVLGLCFGWVPVLLWILIGCVFIGALHDFAALIISVRHEGRSIAHVIENHLSYQARQIFLLFCVAALVLIIAIFALLVAKTFVAIPAVATASVLFIFIAVGFGLVHRAGVLPLWVTTGIFVLLLGAAAVAGVIYPCDPSAFLGLSTAGVVNFWMAVLFIYVFVAASAPVWILLQPRDYLNSFLLYAMILVGLIGILVAAPSLDMPAFTGMRAVIPGAGERPWLIVPMLFVTIACGACSGFHALVASGTSSKQLRTEGHALRVGYGGMIVEGVVAVIALIAAASLGGDAFYETLRHQGPVAVFSSGLAAVSVRLGIPLEMGKVFVSLTVAAFLLTTLDTAARLARFTVQELGMPPKGEVGRPGWLRSAAENRYLTTSLVLAAAGFVAVSGEAQRIWPVFGAANQLLAGLTLLTITLGLWAAGKNVWVALVPFIFMMAISIWALIELLIINSESAQWPLVGSAVVLLVLAAALMVSAVAAIRAKGGRHVAV